MSAIILLSTISIARGLLAALFADHHGGDDSTRGRRRLQPVPVPVETTRQPFDHPR